MSNLKTARQLLRIAALLILLLLVVSSSKLSAQEKERGFYLESHTFPKDSTAEVVFSYRIPYEKIIFIKENGRYSSSIEISLEILSNDEVVKREYSQKQIVLSDYLETRSASNFVEGLIITELPINSYKVLPSYKSDYSNKRISFKQIDLAINKDSTGILNPIIVDRSSDGRFHLLNQNGEISFSPHNQYFVIPARNDVEQLEVTVNQDEKIISKKKLDLHKKGSPKYVADGSIQFVIDTTKLDYSFFILENISRKLKEGKSSFTLSHGKEVKTYELSVVWHNKPKSLNDGKIAIQLLSNIVPKSEVEKLLDNNEEKYLNTLSKFWEKYDKKTDTEFNEIMNEFYERCDYAIENFNTLNKQNGAESDRGKIYIKYGSPDSIERNYSDKDEVIELWKYEKLQKEFVFIDTSRLGNYILAK
ncbi:MAG: GWxTD domain-containing protein [Bacteroidetes bacterium]|nr:GWxTD domain-containing protein [Bacteroidota bacterium]